MPSLSALFPSGRRLSPRRILAVVGVPLVAAVTLTACGSSSPSAGTDGQVTASGSFGKSPSVTIPGGAPSGTLVTKTLVQGHGPTVGKNDAFLSNFSLYVWRGKKHAKLDSTYPNSPEVLPSTLLPAFNNGIIGHRVGSKVLMVIPPKDGYGSSGNSAIGVTGSDTLVFVMDIVRRYADNASATGTHVSNGGGSLPTVTAKQGAAPTVTIPKTSPPQSLVAKTLAKGSGPAVTKGDTVVEQYTGVNWRTGKVFDSTWSRHAPFSFQIGASPAQVISGWTKGLEGKTVGSRVLLVIPPADAYGKAGRPANGIKGTDTLVFVVDILGAVKPASTSTPAASGTPASSSGTASSSASGTPTSSG